MSTLRRRLMMAGKKSPIPSEYQLVEYLQSNGANIDTLYRPQLSTFRVIWDGYYISGQMLFGAGTTFSNNNFEYWLGYGAGYTMAYNGIGHDIYIPSGERFILDANKNNWTMNIGGVENTYTRTLSTEYCPNTFVLFGLHRGDASYERNIKARAYEIVMYEDDIIIRDYWPVVRKSDNKPGMYDIVNHVFYTNQDSGEFIVGPDTTWQG